MKFKVFQDIIYEHWTHQIYDMRRVQDKEQASCFKTVNSWISFNRLRCSTSMKNKSLLLVLVQWIIVLNYGRREQSKEAIRGVRRVPSENTNIAQVVANRENELSSLIWAPF